MSNMVNKPLVSIIIPIYNAEDYLRRCLDSVRHQTYTNYEVILINDGSSDNSGMVCEYYKNLDGRFKVFHQSNQGVSAARNRGIVESVGIYTTFLDADDIFLTDAIQTMTTLFEVNDADCIRTKCSIEYKTKVNHLYEDVLLGRYEGNDLQRLRFAAAIGDLLCYSGLLMIKSAVIAKRNLKFPVGIAMMEDAWFYTDLLNSIGSIYISASVTYKYFIHDASASRSMDDFLDKVKGIIQVNSHVASKGFLDIEIKKINAIHISNIASLVMVRGDQAALGDVYNMMNLVAANTDAMKLYKSADLSSLTIYHRIATWAVIKQRRRSVAILRMIRKASGK